MVTKFVSFIRARRGTAAVEFALIVPFMLLFLAGTVEFGRAYQVYSAVNRLATGYAAAWSDCGDSPAGTCATELAVYASTAAMRNIVPQLTATISLRMMQFDLPATGSAVTSTYATPSGITLTTAEFTIAQSAIPALQTGVVVTVSYAHTLMFFGTIMGPIVGSVRNVSYTVAQLK